MPTDEDRKRAQAWMDAFRERGVNSLAQLIADTRREAMREAEERYSANIEELRSAYVEQRPIGAASCSREVAEGIAKEIDSWLIDPPGHPWSNALRHCAAIARRHGGAK